MIINCPENNFKDSHCVNASKIALDIFKKPIINTVILGAFAKATKVVSLQSIEKAIEQRFKDNKDMIEKNKIAVRKAYEETKD